MVEDSPTDAAQLAELLAGLAADAESYFDRAEAAAEPANTLSFHDLTEPFTARDAYWSQLPDEVRVEADRLRARHMSLVGPIARLLRGSLLTSEADERDIMQCAKSMRAALQLRQYVSENARILNDEDIVLGVEPAYQTDDRPARPSRARGAFRDGVETVRAILELVAAAPGSTGAASDGGVETARYRPNTAFIMMWMDPSLPDLEDVCVAIKEVFGQFGIHAVRADDIQHEGKITDRIISEIMTAEYCFADLSGARPNVYYEVGYAHALARRVILFCKAGTSLHFDLAGYNCPAYTNATDLKRKLTLRLEQLTNKRPRPSEA